VTHWLPNALLSHLCTLVAKLCRAVLCHAVLCCVMLCAAADCSSHPLLLTETAVAPTGVRAQLAQLVFEAYGLPAMSMVAAAPAAFYHHYTAHQQPQQQQQQQQAWQQLGPEGVPGLSVGLCGSSSALVVCSGHSATYVVPVYKVRRTRPKYTHILSLLSQWGTQFFVDHLRRSWQWCCDIHRQDSTAWHLSSEQS
jgi:hypothetical protein